MNRVVTSREEILKTSAEMVAENGFESINIRAVAAACNVSVGSVYNYFPSKSELVLAVVESIWEEILHKINNLASKADFIEAITAVFNDIRTGGRKYPEFFSLHSMSAFDIDAGKGRKVMNQYLGEIKAELTKALENDKSVSASAFSDSFTESDFIDFVFLNMIVLLSQKKKSCAKLNEAVKRIIY